MASNCAKCNSEDYQPISFDDEPCLSKSSSDSFNQPSWVPTTSCGYMVYAIAASFIFLSGVLMGPYLYSPVHDEPAPSIFHGTNFETSPRTFNGSFFRRSQYSGPPSPDMDKAWAQFADTGSPLMPHYPAFISVSESDAQMSTGYSLDTAVRINTPSTNGYLASLEVFHNLHCLNYIRKFIHLDYYKATDPGWAGKKSLREHADHCIDMLREVLMCKSDTGLITYHWIKGTRAPAPDFSTKHMCRDPEDVLRWTREHEIHLTQMILKEGQVSELPEMF